MGKVLITGGAGFVGFSLAERLSAGDNEITIIDDLSRGRKDAEFESLIDRENVEFINGDLTDPRLFVSLPKNYDYIYHLAAVIGVRKVMDNPDRVLYVNAVSTLNLFDFAKNMSRLKKIFFSSTSEIYAGTQRHFGIQVPTKEDVPLTLFDIKSERTTYMLSKMYGESVCFAYRIKHNMPITVGRYHNVYGPRMGFLHVIPEMFAKIGRSETVDVASPYHTRAMCYISDAIEMTVLAGEQTNAEGEILNIGNGVQEITVRELVETIADVLGKKIIINELPDTPGSPQRRCPDMSKTIKLIGYYPKVALRDGIAKTYEWYDNKLEEIYE